MDLFFIIVLNVLTVYYWILVASVLMSWIPEIKRSKVGQVIDKIADPYMRIFRGFLVFGAMDFTPMLGFFFYYFGLNALDALIG